IFKNRKAPAANILKIILAVAAVSWLTVCLGYKFERTFSPHSLAAEDWEFLGWGPAVQTVYKIAPLPDSFLRGIAFGAYHDGRGHASFFKGEYSNGGWISYFPTAFLFKTPAAILFLMALGIIFRLRKKEWLNRNELLLALPAL